MGHGVDGVAFWRIKTEKNVESRNSFLPILGLLHSPILDFGSGAGQTDGQADDGLNA